MIKYFFSNKEDGSMCNTNNKTIFLQKKGIKEKDLVCAGLVHGIDVQVVSKSSAGKIIKERDALITKEEGLFLSVTVADCIPLFLWDQEKGIIAIAHAGWRGIRMGIATSVVRKMKKLSCEKINVFIGAGIGKCHFQVSKEIADSFHPFCSKKEDRFFVDLKEKVKHDLRSEGVVKIEINNDCTYCEKEHYFSYRRDRELNTMIAVIGNVA